MSIAVMSGLGTLVVAGATLSYTQNFAAAAMVGCLGGAATIEAGKRETQQAEQRWAVPSPNPAVPTAVVANATPTATATAINTVNVAAPSPHYTITLPEMAAPVAPSPAPQPAAPTASRFRAVSELPTIDATEPLSREQGVLIVAKKDSGKTTTIKAAIRHRHAWTQGHCQWLIADPKGSQFCGLERTDAYLFVDDRNIEDLLGLLDSAMAELRRRIEARRETGKPTEAPYLTVLVDEWLSLLLFCKSHSKDLFEQVAARLTTLIVQGREDRVHVWLVTHSHLCGELGLSSQVRGNLQVYALGRKPEGRAEALGSIEAAIRDQYLLVDQDLRKDFLKAIQTHETGEAPLCFNPEQKFLVQLPDLSGFVDWQYPIPQGFDPLNIPIGQLRETLEAIDECETKAQMSEVFGVPKGGKSQKWAELVRLWDLVERFGVDGAMDNLTS